MRILIYTDVHYCLYSSLMRSRGEKYSTRIENIINSLNWAESLAILEQCDAVFCLGDFFDQSQLVAEEVTALKDVNWCGLTHVFLVGNHEISRGNLDYSTAHLFWMCPNTNIIDAPMIQSLDDGETELCLLPYIESSKNKDSVASFFDGLSENPKRRILLMHNDIAGIQYGPIISKEGFGVDDLYNFCDICIDGHLHNGMQINDQLITLGNLTGQNFSEDATKYGHYACILDTETLKVDYYENPYAFNFYKFEVSSVAEFKKELKNFKNNAIVSVKCGEEIANELRGLIEKDKRILCNKITVSYQKTKISEEEEQSVQQLLNIDHLQSFIEFVHASYGDSDIINDELQHVCS